MSVQATNTVNGVQSPVIIKIDAKRDKEKNTFTSVWQGLQNMGYSETEIAKISKEMEKEYVNGKKFVATKIANGTDVNVTDAISRAGVKMPSFGNLTTNKTVKNYDVQTHVSNTAASTIQQNKEQPIQTFRGKPINVEPNTLNVEDVKEKYGDNKFLQVAYKMKDLNEANGGDKTITGKSYYQPWCADMVNYCYEQFNGTNPFAKAGARNSSVAGIKKWAKNNNVYNEARSPEQIQQQMQNFNPGDVVVFNQRYHYKTTNGDIYRNNDVRHIGVVVAAKDGKIVLMEGNTNERQLDANGNFVVDKNGIIRMKSKIDGIMLKEYDANALFCRGYSGYADMSKYQ